MKQDEQKKGYDWVTEMKASGLFQDILYIAERVTRNAESLILNMDNNAAECYNSVVAKFVGGKRINYTARRSYATRCEAAAISYNVPAGEFPRYIHKKVTHASPGKYTKKIIARRAQNIAWKKSRRTLFSGIIKQKRKAITEADENYGLPSSDMHEEEYESRVKEFLNNLHLSKEKCEILQNNTIGQADCLLWKEERSKRLTASVFGQICKQRANTHCAALVKTILYNPFHGNIATNWGKEHEKIAIRLYEEIHNVAVAECSLYFDAKKPYLAATPDGLIGDNDIIEVKCPYSAAKTTPIDAIQKQIIKFAELREGRMFLKRSSNYFYQVQEQLHITQRRIVFLLFGHLLELSLK
ncbi:uncharacterized protein LOC130450968 [Diorhabda sublineata]|uniref:uncharacterized protein LOC130450968 n=1 Tax=Diorhabda sublineata TaxID=1163346 RepID=UPI0024E16167|nr:uncharacterized protein LOC130450968 [Diorhabda sublineata]